jgi:hypothetical protein
MCCAGRASQLEAASGPAATENPHAHDLYLRAKELFYRSDQPSLNQAVNFYNQAIAADPNYAAPGPVWRIRTLPWLTRIARRSIYFPS